MLAVLPAAYYNTGKESESVEKTYEELQIKDDFMFGLIMRNPKLALGDDTTKIILNTKGTMDDISPELKKLLDYIDGKIPADDYTRELDEAVQSARKNKKWRLDYMTLQMHYQEKFEQGVQQENRRFAMSLLADGELSLEKIARCSGLTLEQVQELKKELQPV